MRESPADSRGLAGSLSGSPDSHTRQPHGVGELGSAPLLGQSRRGVASPRRRRAKGQPEPSPRPRAARWEPRCARPSAIVGDRILGPYRRGSW